jgi:tetratricopeptide (TPR) repeat protein
MKTPKLYILITIVITMYLHSACSKHAAGENRLKPTNSVDSSAVLAKADALFREREDISKLRLAIDELSKARSAGQNYDIEWTYAKYNYFLGTHLADSVESGAAFEEGKAAGKIAVRLEPNKPEGHFWYAANLGEIARENPVTVGLSSVTEIQSAMNRVIDIQPDYQNASAYDGLGQVEYATRLTSGSIEKAIEYYEKGIAVDKGNAHLYLHLAEAYLAQKKKPEAKQQLEIVMQMKPNPDYVPEHRETMAKAKQLLESNF